MQDATTAHMKTRNKLSLALDIIYMNPPRLINALILGVFFVTSSICSFAQSDEDYAAKAHEIHTHIIALDTHLDAPGNLLRAGWDIGQRHDYRDDFTQLDFPRMREGGLTGGFFAIYTPQGPRTPEGLAHSRDYALQLALAIRMMVASHSDQCTLALNSADASKIAATGKRIVYMSIENGYSLGKDLTLVKTFYNLGVRVIGFVHFANNDLGDSASDLKGPEWHGLSPEGKALITECNRLGIVIDASHSSDDVFHQMLELSKTPIILTHTSSRAVYNHPRNATDKMMKELANHGGVIQVNSYSTYLASIPESTERNKALAQIYSKLSGRMDMTPEQRTVLMQKMAEINHKYPAPMTTFDIFMKHVLHTIEVVGIDHVGIGLDLDGGGGVKGLEDATCYYKITAALLKAGYSEEDLKKFWGGNSLRVMKAAENYAASLKVASTYSNH
jgi:membrane dipeptidase